MQCATDCYNHIFIHTEQQVADTDGFLLITNSCIKETEIYSACIAVQWLMSCKSIFMNALREEWLINVSFSTTLKYPCIWVLFSLHAYRLAHENWIFHQEISTIEQMFLHFYTIDRILSNVRFTTCGEELLLAGTYYVLFNDL